MQLLRSKPFYAFLLKFSTSAFSSAQVLALLHSLSDLRAVRDTPEGLRALLVDEKERALIESLLK